MRAEPAFRSSPRPDPGPEHAADYDDNPDDEQSEVRNKQGLPEPSDSAFLGHGPEGGPRAGGGASGGVEPCHAPEMLPSDLPCRRAKSSLLESSSRLGSWP
jgi:hypothetical protein